MESTLTFRGFFSDLQHLQDEFSNGKLQPTRGAKLCFDNTDNIIFGLKDMDVSSLR